MLRTRLTLRPGQSGTRRLVEEYGTKLICVRYRYDDTQKKRYKTVELIVEEVDWLPRPTRPAPTDFVHVRIPYSEHVTRRSIRLLGGTFDYPSKTYRLTYLAAVALRLTDCIVNPSAPIDNEPSTPASTSGREEDAIYGGRGGRAK